MTDRKTTCRYLKTYSTQCTGEAVDPGGEIVLCTKHLAAAQRLLFEAMRKARAADRK